MSMSSFGTRERNLKGRVGLSSLALVLLGGWAASITAIAQMGPFDPDQWPGSLDKTKVVHYVVTDGGLEPPSASWTGDDLQILSGGDQVTSDITIGGHQGKKVTGNYLNIADRAYDAWQNEPFIDILAQVYGDAALFNAQGRPRNFNFLTGTLPELSAPNGGQIPVEAANKKWNWVLFRIPNGTRPSDGSRYVGSIPANAQGGVSAGGVNGGTIRMEGVPNLIVRVLAFGQQGAFGEPDQVNKFAAAESCDPEPNTNLAWIDLAKGTAAHLVVINDGDQKVTLMDNVGPAGDRRKAVVPTGTFLNFGVVSNYLGKPCNDPRAVKIGVEFYDDPSFAGAGVRFGPEAFATDATGGIGIYAEDRRQTLTGSGKWIRRSWIVPSVNLRGVNAGTLTAGPRFISQNGQVAVASFHLGVLRVGTHPLAGVDPLPDWVEDPNICTDAYGSYAELDLAKDIRNGLEVGSSGGDQHMIVDEAGPANDRRMAVRPAREDGPAGFAHAYLNFAITGEALGPSSQPPARMALCVTYYDDPALAGKRFKPEVYMTDRNGVTTFGFTPDSYFVTLEGTGGWVEAYWELPDVKFNGVNQGPQAAARFSLQEKIFFTRIRYAVIRPCGPNAGVNALENCKPTGPVLTASLAANRTIRLQWPNRDGFTLQSTDSLESPTWRPAADSVVEGNDRVAVLPLGDQRAFYRLVKP